jgi:hypothetical protein
VVTSTTLRASLDDLALGDQELHRRLVGRVVGRVGAQDVGSRHGAIRHRHRVKHDLGVLLNLHVILRRDLLDLEAGHRVLGTATDAVRLDLASRQSGLDNLVPLRSLDLAQDGHDIALGGNLLVLDDVDEGAHRVVVDRNGNPTTALRRLSLRLVLVVSHQGAGDRSTVHGNRQILSRSGLLLSGRHRHDTLHSLIVTQSQFGVRELLDPAILDDDVDPVATRTAGRDLLHHGGTDTVVDVTDGEAGDESGDVSGQGDPFSRLTL